jgi:hypothetical protein
MEPVPNFTSIEAVFGSWTGSDEPSSPLASRVPGSVGTVVVP